MLPEIVVFANFSLRIATT